MLALQKEVEGNRESESSEQIFVCEELSHLTDLLKSQLSRLSLKEEELKERERRLGQLSLLAADAQSMISQYVQDEVTKATHSNHETSNELRRALLAKEREVERLKHSYEQTRQTNQQLRSKLEEECCAKMVLERELKQLQARVSSLQTAATVAKNTQAETKAHEQQSTADHLKKKPPAVTSSSGVEERDTLSAILMNWLSQLLSLCTCSTHTTDSCRQARHLLPLLAKLLPHLPSSHHLPLLKITLWTVKIFNEKSSPVSTLRTIGRYVYYPTAMPTATPTTSNKSLFINSSDIAVRTLSSLCLLSTLSDDHAHLMALQCLLQDLVHAECRELFVSYSGVSVLCEVMRPATSKRRTQMAVTILTMLSLHSVGDCCCECCIESVASLLQYPGHLTPDTINNLTILLQRLSQIKYCWKWFMSYGIPSLLDHLPLAGESSRHTQLRLKNMQSILNNKPLK